MALKITTAAAEMINDIILHKLQQDGLEKAESLERQLFDEINSLPSINGSEEKLPKVIFPNGEYAFVYKNTTDSILLLAIVHTSRLPKAANL